MLPDELADRVEDQTIIPSLIETLRLDPRPSYHDDPEREYGMSFSGYNIRFLVEQNMLKIIDVQKSV